MYKVAVISTNEWLKNDYSERQICRKLIPYFRPLKERDILKLLQSFGMYRSSSKVVHAVKQLEKEHVWNLVRNEELKLKAEWDGPDVPIFIFPVDDRNKRIINEYKGRAGLAFKDKIFLFISPGIEQNDIKSLFTHEYHHSCRLAKLKKEESEFTLLDIIVMEGLAEYAVLERLGMKHVSAWTSYYHEDQAVQFLKRIILPNQFLTREDHKHNQIIYGTGFYPKMLGYFVGFHIVKKYSDETGENTKEMFRLDAGKFVEHFI